jgi:hypothetical protein
MHSTEVPRLLSGSSRKVNIALFWLWEVPILAVNIFPLSREPRPGLEGNCECFTFFEQTVDDYLQHGLDARYDPGPGMISIVNTLLGWSNTCHGLVVIGYAQAVLFVTVGLSL